MVDTPVTQVTIGASLSSSFTQAFDRARATYDRFEGSVLKLNRTLGQASVPYERMLAITDRSSASMRTAAYAAREVDRQYATVIGRMTSLGTATDTANRAMRDQATAMDAASRSTALAVRGQTALQIALQRTADNATHARDMIRAMGQEMATVSQGLRRGGGGLDMPQMQRRIGYRGTMSEYDGPTIDLSRMQRRIEYDSGAGVGGGGYGYGFGGGGRYGSGPTMLPPPPPPTFGQRMRNGFGNFGRGLASQFSSGGVHNLIGAYIAERGLHELYSQGAERQDEYTKMAMAGQSPQDISNNRRAAVDVANTVGGTTINQNLAATRHLRYVFGNTEDAQNNLGAVQQATKVMGFMNPNIDAERNSFDMTKALEIYGVSQDKNKFNSTMHRMEAASIATGGKITGRDFQQFTAMSGGASTSLTPEALTGLVTSVGGEIGASRAGNAFSMAIRGLVGGRMPKEAKNALGRFGLMDRQTGRVTGSAQLMSDPKKWVDTYLIPSMKSAGYYREDAEGNVTDESKKALTGVFAKIFSNKNEANLFTLLTTQGRRYDKDQEQVNKANRTNFEAIIGRSPTVAFNNMKSAFQNMLGTMSESDMSHAVAIMNMAASGFNAIGRMDPKNLGAFTEITAALIAMGPAIYGARLAFTTFLLPLAPLARGMVFAAAQIIPLTAGVKAFGATAGLASRMAGSFALVYTAMEALIGLIEAFIPKANIKAAHDSLQEDYDEREKTRNDPKTGFFGRAWAGFNQYLDRGAASAFTDDGIDSTTPLQEREAARRAARQPREAVQRPYTFGGPARIPGHAYGGSFTVKGGPGTDANLVQFMATAGEKVTVETEGSKGNNGPDTGSTVTPKELGKEIGKSFVDYLLSHQRQLAGANISFGGLTAGPGLLMSGGGGGGLGGGGLDDSGGGGDDGDATPRGPAVGHGGGRFGLFHRQYTPSGGFRQHGGGRGGGGGGGLGGPERGRGGGGGGGGGIDLSGDATARATSLIKAKEGFQASAKWDVNHYRLGYGSDTMTDEQGNVHEVHAGDRTDRAGADRDLARRVKIFANKISGQVGVDHWKKLSPDAQAALTSMGYNYGGFAARRGHSDYMKPLRDAIATEDPHKIAEAVRERAGDNGGVNRKRRLQEAELIERGGTPAQPTMHEGSVVDRRDRGQPPQAITPLPGGGDLQGRLAAVKRSGLIKDQECVSLAMATVGIKKGTNVEGANVHDWVKGEDADAGTLKRGTPVSTFLDRQGREASTYGAGSPGGGGTRGAHLDHAATFDQYTYDSQGRRTGMRVLEQFKGSAPHMKDYKFGQGWGEGNASNYHAIKVKSGSYLGGTNNPMNALATPATPTPHPAPAVPMASLSPRRGDQRMAAAQDRAAKRQQVAMAEGAKRNVHAPITIHGGNHNPQQIAQLVQQHIGRHENEGARRARGGTFDWTA